MTEPVAALLEDERLHVQHGPIDLIIEAYGTPAEVRLSYAQAWDRFQWVLEELVGELPLLRSPLIGGFSGGFAGPVARTMAFAVAPFRELFVTPMAAVAGAVADEILAAMLKGRNLAKAYVNNGGDIALHLEAGNQFDVGLISDPAYAELAAAVQLHTGMGIGGIATSGAGGRSQSLGIADAVTVLAPTAAQADAAATLLANAVDLPGHPAVLREPAKTLHPDSDLGERPVTVTVGDLTPREIDLALARGVSFADELRQRGLISAAVLCLQGEVRVSQDAGLPGLLCRDALQPVGVGGCL